MIFLSLVAAITVNGCGEEVAADYSLYPLLTGQGAALFGHVIAGRVTGKQGGGSTRSRRRTSLRTSSSVNTKRVPRTLILGQ